jgi:hypothetical protein
MNAREEWKQAYRSGELLTYTHDERHEIKIWGWIDVLHRASLERKIERLERENKAHVMRINGVIRMFNDGADTWQHMQSEEDGQCLHCGYPWPCEYETIRNALIGSDDDAMLEMEVTQDKIEVGKYVDVKPLSSAGATQKERNERNTKRD